MKYHINKFVTVILWVTGFSCLVFFVLGDYLKLAGYALSIILVMLPFYFYSKSPKWQKKVDVDFIEAVQLLLAGVTFLNLLGSLAGYYDPRFAGYDKILHFVNPIFIFSFTAFIPVLFEKNFFGRTSLWSTLAGNLLLIILGSFAWEFYEAGIDAVFPQAHMLGHYGDIYYDTLYDLVADFSGGLIAQVLIWRYFYGYILKSFRIK